MWLPDTNAWIRYLNPEPSPVKARFREHPVTSLSLCDVVLAELYFGAYKSARRDRNVALIERLRAEFKSIPFDSSAANSFGQVRAALVQQGQPIGPYDMQIAAIALAHGLAVVTHNTPEFSRVDGLILEDWEL